METPVHGLAGTTRTAHWRELGLHAYIRIFIVGALICYLFRMEIRGIIETWLADSSWSHGFLIPLFSAYFIIQNKKQILNLQTRPNYIGLLLLVLVVGFYALNRFSPSGYEYFCRISLIATLGAVVFFWGGWRLVRYTWLPIVFLVFAVPLPARFYRALTIPMRQWAAAVASGLLNLVPELEATANGVVIDVFYRGRALEPGLDVAEACAGMRLLMAFVALGVAMAYLHERALWQRIILLASTVPIAIFCNIVRVTVTGFIYILIHPRYAQGVYHDVLGLAMLPLALGLYGFLAWFMSSLFVRESDGACQDIVIRRGGA
ncbi:MAG: exosortase/archaeosortase family protein [Phycisphaerales bacterium]|nr:MAG: exosortase/archaeosortase family protein [Phycisphaerales bacterium]